MNLISFKNTLNNNEPPALVRNLLKAMWYIKKDNWNEAHHIAQDDNSIEGSWVHAYIHRCEGDSGNASYWYARAGKTFPKISLEKEWEIIVSDLLEIK